MCPCCSWVLLILSGVDNMQPVVWTVIGLIAYIGGLAIILTMTPRLLKLRFDEGLFMGIAAADVFGGLLAFAPVGLTFALFNGASVVGK